MKSYYRGPIGSSHQRSYERYHPRPVQTPIPQDWGSQPQLKTAIVRTYYLRNGLSYGLQIWPIHSQGPSKQKPMKIWQKRERRRIQGVPKFLSTPYYLRNG